MMTSLQAVDSSNGSYITKQLNKQGANEWFARVYVGWETRLMSQTEMLIKCIQNFHHFKLELAKLWR